MGGWKRREGRNFLKNHTSTIWSVKSAAKKTNKNQYSPPQKKGRTNLFSVFFPRVCENHEI